MREHTEAIAPPRALWVPFVLGRPFGAPNDAAFQHRVLLAALKLLEATAGPVLADFPEEAPADAADVAEVFACPVSFATHEATDDATALQQELAALGPWHALARERAGRTTAALSGLTPESAARAITDFIRAPAGALYRSDIERGNALRLLCEDLKSYYLEAVNAQPGRRAAHEAHAWFWRETVAGRVLVALRETCLAQDDASVKNFGANNLVPRAIQHALRHPGSA